MFVPCWLWLWLWLWLPACTFSWGSAGSSCTCLTIVADHDSWVHPPLPEEGRTVSPSWHVSDVLGRQEHSYTTVVCACSNLLFFCCGFPVVAKLACRSLEDVCGSFPVATDWVWMVCCVKRSVQQRERGIKWGESCHLEQKSLLVMTKERDDLVPTSWPGLIPCIASCPCVIGEGWRICVQACLLGDLTLHSVCC